MNKWTLILIAIGAGASILVLIIVVMEYLLTYRSMRRTSRRSMERIVEETRKKSTDAPVSTAPKTETGSIDVIVEEFEDRPLTLVQEALEEPDVQWLVRRARRFATKHKDEAKEVGVLLPLAQRVFQKHGGLESARQLARLIYYNSDNPRQQLEEMLLSDALRPRDVLQYLLADLRTVEEFAAHLLRCLTVVELRLVCLGRPLPQLRQEHFVQCKECGRAAREKLEKEIERLRSVLLKLPKQESA